MRFFCVFFAVVSLINGAYASEKVFNVFNRKNIAWVDGKKVRDCKKGFKNGSVDKPAVIWFKSVPGKLKSYKFALKPIAAGDYDFLIFEYRIEKGSCLTMDTWWNKGRMKRPLSKVAGAGEWQTLKLPVKGNILKACFSLTNLPDDKNDSVCKVSFRPIKGIKESNKIGYKLYKIDSPLIIPAPKRITRSGKKYPLTKDGKVLFGICVNKLQVEFKNIIIDEIAEVLNVKPQAIAVVNNISKLKNKTVIDLQFGKGCKIKVPVNKEAYAISSSLNNAKNVITMAANDKAGLYWAWKSLKQLITKPKGEYTVVACKISDWPDYPIRGFIAYTEKELKECLNWKTSVNVLPWWGRIKEWRKPGAKYRKDIEESTTYALERGCDVILWVCPFFYRPISISNDKDIQTLMNTHEISLKKGGRFQFLGVDDGGRDGKSFTKDDRKAYNNDILLSHAWYAKKMSDKILKKYPDATVLMGIKDYESAKGVEGYYDRIGVSKKLIIGWTGPQCVTFNYPKHIVNKYLKGISNRRFYLCDNTPGQAHGMYRGLTICEKYGEGYEELYKSGKCVGAKPNYGFSNPMRNIRALSIVEYMWNASIYNAEKARQRAIVKVSGSLEAVRPILKYADEYLKIAYKYPIDKRLLGTKRKDFSVARGLRNVIGRKVLEDKELSKYSLEDEEYKRLQDKITNMDKILKRIDNSNKNKLLNKEFHMMQQNLKDVIAHLKKNSKPLPLVNPAKAFVFDIKKIPGGTNYKKRGPEKIMGVAIYGKQTATNTLTAVFKMKSLPARDVVLKLNGWDCDKSIPPMIIKLNGNTIFTGKTTFGRTYPYTSGPGEMKFNISAKFFKKGRNEMNIIDNAASSDMIDNWIVVGGIKFEF